MTYHAILNISCFQGERINNWDAVARKLHLPFLRQKLPMIAKPAREATIPRYRKENASHKFITKLGTGQYAQMLARGYQARWFAAVPPVT